MLPGLPSDDPPETPKPKNKHHGTEDLPSWFDKKIKGCWMQTFISQFLVKSKLWHTVQNENESKKMKQWPAVQNDRNLGVCSICERGCRCTDLPHYWTFGNTQKRRKSKKCKLCVSCKASQYRVLGQMGGTRVHSELLEILRVFSENFSHTQLPILLHLKIYLFQNSSPSALPSPPS